jgi:D-lactate dehydrogenase
MSDDDLLALLRAAGRRIALADGTCLFREGDAADFVFFVDSGALLVRKRSEDGPEVVLRELGPGDLGGLTSLLAPRPRSATLVARGTSSVVAVSHAVMTERLATDPKLARLLLAHLGQKVREKTQQVATLVARSGRDARELVAFFDAKPYEREAFEARLSESLRIHFVDARLGPSTVALARGYPVVCAFVNDVLDAPVIQELARFGTRLVAMRCAGYNNVDLRAASEHGVDVVRVPAYSPHAVAEHAMALVLTLNRKTHRAYNRVREGNFSLTGLVGFDLHGRTAGLIGLGKIGRCFSSILRGFGMEVLAYDTGLDPAAAAACGATLVGLDDLLSRSDVVSLHVPLTPETHHLLDGTRIARMKPGSMLVNTSRGGLVDTTALLGALKSGHIGAAGLDVYEEESAYFFRDRSDRAIDDDVLARLMTFPNVLVTSHQGFLTKDALDNIASTTLDNIAQHLAGARGDFLANRVTA